MNFITIKGDIQQGAHQNLYQTRVKWNKSIHSNGYDSELQTDLSSTGHDVPTRRTKDVIICSMDRAVCLDRGYGAMVEWWIEGKRKKLLK